MAKEKEGQNEEVMDLYTQLMLEDDKEKKNELMMKLMGIMKTMKEGGSKDVNTKQPF